jgi:hypothetical protein
VPELLLDLERLDQLAPQPDGVAVARAVLGGAGAGPSAPRERRRL